MVWTKSPWLHVQLNFQQKVQAGAVVDVVILSNNVSVGLAALVTVSPSHSQFFEYKKFTVSCQHLDSADWTVWRYTTDRSVFRRDTGVPILGRCVSYRSLEWSLLTEQPSCRPEDFNLSYLLTNPKSGMLRL